MGTTDQASLQQWVAEAGERLAVPGVVRRRLSRRRGALRLLRRHQRRASAARSTTTRCSSSGRPARRSRRPRSCGSSIRARSTSPRPVRTYLPELTLQDEDVARNVTVLQLLNHTAGWSGDVFETTGDGDDALARYVERMAGVEQVTPLGATVSYNNASLSIAGRIIEKLTGKTYEQAIKELIFEPLGLDHCYFFPNDIMTRRFAVGHNQHADGTITVARPWALPRNGNPAGGISSNAADLIAWARFHLGDGRAADGTRVLPEDAGQADAGRHRRVSRAAPSATPSASAGCCATSTACRVVGHGGDTIGQHSSFDIIPEHDFAIVGLTNCGPNGNQLLEELRHWAFETYLGRRRSRSRAAGAARGRARRLRRHLRDDRRDRGDRRRRRPRRPRAHRRDQAGGAGQADRDRRGAAGQPAVPARHPARHR